MKSDIYALDGKKSGSIALPKQFQETIRPDLIKKANRAIESNKRQPYGAFLGAGIRAAAEMSRRRKKFKTSYDKGISRVPRKHLWRRGTQFAFVGAFAPGTVKGRRAHPPKAQKDFSKKLNKNENRFAIRSAISATIIPDLVKARGHKFKELATVISNQAESLTKTKEVNSLLKKLNFIEELSRISERKVRAGKGKLRNRKHKTKTGPLLVVSKKCALSKAAINLQGIDICEVKKLNVNLLAPGGDPGRLTIFTEDAIKTLEEEKLFFRKPKEQKPKENKK
jgi:large subunit ribosomal protein L4e